MSYVVLGDKTIQNYINMLNVYSPFNLLSQTQQIQYINFIQQECANISKKNNLEYYKVVNSMTTLP
jgi:hypothetical protein